MSRFGKAPVWLIEALVAHCGRERRGISALTVLGVWSVLAAKHAGRDGRTPRCSQARLAADCGCGVATIERALRVLRSVGALDAVGTRSGDRRGPSRYTLHFDGPKPAPVTDSQASTDAGLVRESPGQTVVKPASVRDESREENPEGASALADARSPLEEQQLGLIGQDGSVDEWQAAAAARAREIEAEAAMKAANREKIGALAALLRDEGRIPPGRNTASG